MLFGCLGAIFFVFILFGATTSDNPFFMYFSVFGIIASLTWGVYSNMKNKEELSLSIENQIDILLKEIPDFFPMQKYTAVDRESFIAIDEISKKVCIIENQHNNKVPLSDTNRYHFAESVYTYNEIIRVEILEDGEMITQTSRASQIGGAIIGGLVAGGVGAIIGGLSGKQSSKQKVTKIQLQIVVNDTNKSFYRISFLDIKAGIGSVNYQEANQTVTHWYNLLGTLIKLADAEEEKISTHTPTNTSVADELIKLSSLLKEGLITQEEFEKQKEKVINM